MYRTKQDKHSILGQSKTRNKKCIRENKINLVFWDSLKHTINMNRRKQDKPSILGQSKTHNIYRRKQDKRSD